MDVALAAGPSSGDAVDGNGPGFDMTSPRRILRCAIYARKSTEHNLDLEFNSLDRKRLDARAGATRSRCSMAL
jgi:hypothetical protein